MFYLQSGYDGRETALVSFLLDRSEFAYSARSEYESGQIPVGSVEFVEQFIGVRKPDYYPRFLSDFLGREIVLVESLRELEKGDWFIKPADRHKRFDARMFNSILRIWQDGPIWASRPVEFRNEWRYYVANGEVLCAFWYLGDDEDEEPPKIDVDWPKGFCGAVDFGRDSKGRILLVENNSPYACGFYGPFSEGEKYISWLKAGFEFLNKWIDSTN